LGCLAEIINIPADTHSDTGAILFSLPPYKWRIPIMKGRLRLKLESGTIPLLRDTLTVIKGDGLILYDSVLAEFIRHPRVIESVAFLEWLKKSDKNTMREK